jgi:hypothetical protein
MAGGVVLCVLVLAAAPQDLQRRTSRQDYAAVKRLAVFRPWGARPACQILSITHS